MLTEQTYTDDLLYQIALSLTPRMTAETVRVLYDNSISAEDVFSMETPQLNEMLGLRPGHGFEKMKLDEALFNARKEIEHMKTHRVHASFLMDDDYPTRLSHIPDAPIVIYSLGETDLDSRHVINVVGTRKPTQYGIDFTRQLVTDLAQYFPDLVVISGLAYGIDAEAHKSAMDAGVATAAVVAHGLNMIYPAAHRDLAKQIIKKGGALVTEYPFDTNPYRQRFLERNRIVAGLADVTVVAESDIKGGAMSTANTAFSYSRDVMALPGRITDKLSSGCNNLIRKEKAHIITSAADLIELAGWQPLDLKVDTTQRNLFPELEGEAKLIYETLRYNREPMPTDRLHSLTLIPMPRLMGVLADMEFDGIVVRHPGNRYSVN